MAVNIVKLAVGVATLDELKAIQAKRRKERRQKAGTPHRVFTRHGPKQRDEILAGGSLYWVIKGYIRARQRFVGFDEALDDEGRKYCLFLVDREVVPTAAWPCQAFQGWRYLDAKRTPPDIKPGDSDDVPQEMAAELRRLGLI